MKGNNPSRPARSATSLLRASPWRRRGETPHPGSPSAAGSPPPIRDLAAGAPSLAGILALVAASLIASPETALAQRGEGGALLAQAQRRLDAPPRRPPGNGRQGFPGSPGPQGARRPKGATGAQGNGPQTLPGQQGNSPSAQPGMQGPQGNRPQAQPGAQGGARPGAASPSAAPQTAPYAAPQTAPYAAPHTAPYAAPQTAPYAAPNTAPYAAPQAAPASAPGVGPSTGAQGSPTRPPRRGTLPPAASPSPYAPAPQGGQRPYAPPGGTSAHNPFAMPPPPPGAPQESFGFFGQAGTGFTYFKESTPKPFTGVPGFKTCKLPAMELPFQVTENCTPQERNTWLLNALAGARTRNAEDFFLLAYYKYSFFWDIDAARAGSFGNWFRSPSNPDSPLPTRGFLRVHEGFADARYLLGAARFGLQVQLTIGRVNSALFGRAGESPGNVYASEAYVPYAMYVGGKSYRGRLYFPMFTVTNKEEEDFTYTTFSPNSKGRGFVMSAGLSNLYHVPRISTVLNLDVSWMDYKFRSVSNDRTRYGGSFSSSTNSARFGLYGTGPYEVFVGPRVGYYIEKYYLPTVLIPGWEKGEADVPTRQLPVRIRRQDTITRFGAQLGVDVASGHRLTTEVDFENRDSNIPVWPSRNMLFVFRYQWTTPSTAEVSRFLRNTERNPTNGTFEGDGGF